MFQVFLFDWEFNSGTFGYTLVIMFGENCVENTLTIQLDQDLRDAMNQQSNSE